MKLKLIIALNILFLMPKIYAESYLFREMQKAKQENVIFQRINAFQLASNNSKVLKQFKNQDEIVFIKYIPTMLSTAPGAMILNIPQNNSENLNLELLRIERSFDYKITTNTGKSYSPNEEIKHYRGIVKGVPNSMVTLTFFKNKARGLIITNKGNFNLVFDKSTQNHILYNDKNLVKNQPFKCSTQSDLLPYSSKMLSKKVKSKSNFLKYVKLYFETDFELYQELKNDRKEVEAFVTGLYQQVAMIYRREEIFLEISEIKIWIEEDPYIANTTSGVLDEFENQGNINGDLGQLLIYRYVKGGGIAYLDRLCSKSTNRSVCNLYNWVSSFPRYSWDVGVSAHEFGHLLGSNHTHACVWNGNGTAIDGCEEPEGNCVKPPIPEEGGTIMSYCHLITSVGINFLKGFGEQPGNVIRNTIDKADCLSSYNLQLIGNSLVCNQATFILENAPTGAFVFWDSSNNNLELVSGQGTNTATFKSKNSGKSKISVKIFGYSEVLEKKVKVSSIPSPSDIQIHSNTEIFKVLFDDFVTFISEYKECYLDKPRILYTSAPNVLLASSPMFDVTTKPKEQFPYVHYGYEWRIKSGAKEIG